MMPCDAPTAAVLVVSKHLQRTFSSAPKVGIPSTSAMTEQLLLHSYTGEPVYTFRGLGMWCVSMAGRIRSAAEEELFVGE